jgi:putative endonuclease
LSKNKEIGRKGESIAVDYLIKKGYTILEKNYKFHRFEIDIIAKNKNTIAFIEVKTRQNRNFGYPVDAVGNKKIDNILKCAGHYIYQTQWKGNIRFDIISILKEPEFSIEHIEDAFF